MLNVLILFGSKSDENVYTELKNKIGEFANVDFAVLSAHRDPGALEKKLAETNADFIVAGAGLAAHLPGVIASKFHKPVIGVPVNSVFSGLDALASIQQMPFGVPVLTTAPDNSDRVAKYLSEFSKNPVNIDRINIIFPQNRKNDSHYVKELKRTREYAEENGFKVSETAFYDEECKNIVFVNHESEVIEGSTEFHIPIFSDEEKKQPETLCKLLKWVSKGGLWFGSNNCRNALKYIEKLNELKRSL